jgi:putative protease
MAEDKIGVVTHYFDQIQVAIVKLDKPLKKGDKIKIAGAAGDFELVVDSMQVDRADIEEADKGDEIGIKVSEKAREGNIVYKVS